jgi:hypothetical protein
MNERAGRSTPSHLEDESRGGETAQGGFLFQDGVLISNIPRWLEYEGFDCLVRESIGDAEVRFFAPGSGRELDLFEMKNHRITPAEFWDEITRFRRIADGSGPTYRSFTLASAGASDDVVAIGNALRRVRDPASFYGEGSPIPENSLAGFTRLIEDRGRNEGEAKFLYEKVGLRWDLGLAQSESEALFRQAVEEHLPAYRDLPGWAVGKMFASLVRLISGRINKPISRLEIESILRCAIEPAAIPSVSPVLIHTATQHDPGRRTDLRFRWDPFFGGVDRAYPSPERWEQQVILPLRETRSWIMSNRDSRRIALYGERRLSTALAFGSVFSAVSGFAVDVNHRGEVWSTDVHPNSDTPAYELDRRDQDGAKEDLIVAIGILRDILPDVESSLKSLGLEGSPSLYLRGSAALVSPQQGNLVVMKLKDAITRRVAESSAKVVHLFFAGPSHLAVFLGHRCNAIGSVQCYEWVGPGRYAPTCRLQT